MLVLYAESGAGKTSLINAGILPRLAKEEFQVLPLTRVQGVIPQDIRNEDIANLYVFNSLLSWAADEDDPRELTQVSLVEFLAEVEHPTIVDGLLSPRVIIFDQFEELLTSYPERWKDREDFFRQVREALDVDPLLRVVFVIREDYIAQLDTYAIFLPERLQTRFRLERMREPAALAAVTGPLTHTSRKYAKGVAEILVDDLQKVQVQVNADKTVEVEGEFIEPVQLQVVCQSLWSKLPPDVAVIEQTHLRTFGDVNRALSRFYEDAIKEVGKGSHLKERRLREWFERFLITPAGTRGTVFRGSEETGGIKNSAVDALERQHIIRAEVRAGSRWHELTHDRFIGPIKSSNAVYQQRRRRIISGLAIGLGPTLIILAALAGWQWLEAEQQRLEAEQQRLEAEQQLKAFAENLQQVAQMAEEQQIEIAAHPQSVEPNGAVCLTLSWVRSPSSNADVEYSWSATDGIFEPSERTGRTIVKWIAPAGILPTLIKINVRAIDTRTQSLVGTGEGKIGIISPGTTGQPELPSRNCE